MSAAVTLDALAPAGDPADLLSLPPRPTLRVSPAPDVDLPYDDELPRPHLPPGQDPLPLPFEPGQLAPVLRLIPSGGETREERAVRGATTLAGSRPSPDRSRPRAALAKPDVRVLVQALCEVLSGTRPAVQLSTSVSPAVLTALRSSATSGPWRSADGGVGPRPAVRSVHVRETSDGVLDVCAVVRRGPRHHALALRIRRRRTRWEATTIQVG